VSYNQEGDSMAVYFVAFYDALYDGNLIGLEPLEAENHSEAMGEFIAYLSDGGEAPDGVAQIVTLEDLPTSAVALV
jgi:hypothetical protein